MNTLIMLESTEYPSANNWVESNTHFGEVTIKKDNHTETLHGTDFAMHTQITVMTFSHEEDVTLFLLTNPNIISLHEYD